MIVLQIAPEIGVGTGVGAVAHALEQQWAARGVDVRRFTLADAAGGWLPSPGGGAAGKAVLALRVVWFSTVGTVLARRAVRRLPPGAVSICHNDAVAGDVYVNHGILQVAMHARGRYLLRMARNPMHLFIALRDGARYRGRAHRVVVNLVDDEVAALRATYPGLRPRPVVIGNGVDVERYRPPTAQERAAARAGLGLADDVTALVFVGHEFARKGLPVVIEALERLPDEVHLVVVGGTPDMVEAAGRDVAARRLTTRVHLVGRAADPRPFFHAGDVFVLPSAYESYGLVVLEALAGGLPVVATPVGVVPAVVRDGETGYAVPARPDEVARAVTALRALPKDRLAKAARAVAEEHSWSAVAGRYLDLFDELRSERGAAR